MGPSSSNKNFSSGTMGTTGGTTGASQPASSGRTPSEDRSSTESANASDMPSHLPKPLMGEECTLIIPPRCFACTQLKYAARLPIQYCPAGRSYVGHVHALTQAKLSRPF